MLSPADRTHLQAAEGWLDLGNPGQANAELEKIAPANRAHPDVLLVRWRVYAKAGKWGAATALYRATVLLSAIHFESNQDSFAPKLRLRLMPPVKETGMLNKPLPVGCPEVLPSHRLISE